MLLRGSVAIFRFIKRKQLSGMLWYISGILWYISGIVHGAGKWPQAHQRLRRRSGSRHTPLQALLSTKS